jgi:hypothetical protein
LQKFLLRDIPKSRYTTGINNTDGKFAAGVNYTNGKFSTGINNTSGKFAEVGGPQISFANPKTTNLQAYKICYICEPSASVAFVDLQFADPIFFAIWTLNFYAV